MLARAFAPRRDVLRLSHRRTAFLVLCGTVAGTLLASAPLHAEVRPIQGMKDARLGAPAETVALLSHSTRTGDRPLAAKPLSGQAFDQRFAAGAPSATQRPLSRLLAQPGRIDPRTAFAARPVEAPDFSHFEQPAPVRVASLSPASSTPDIATDPVEAPKPLVAEAVAEMREAIVMASLPGQVPAPAFRPRAAEPTAEKPEQRPAPAAAEETEKPATVLAYARPEKPAVDEAPAKQALIPWPGVKSRNKTAIYDISAGVVHMPNGDRLEAHSGRGEMRDNPKYAHVKMRGPTPPSTYKLSMREARFHGVEAIRLNPIDGKAPLGRVGLLAHTYLLRVPGDSSGCIVFKKYDKFLAAFKRGEITHVVVVPRYKGGVPAVDKPEAEMVAFSRSR